MKNYPVQEEPSRSMKNYPDLMKPTDCCRDQYQWKTIIQYWWKPRPQKVDVPWKQSIFLFRHEQFVQMLSNIH